jgi:hypothetical protein
MILPPAPALLSADTQSRPTLLRELPEITRTAALAGLLQAHERYGHLSGWRLVVARLKAAWRASA